MSKSVYTVEFKTFLTVEASNEAEAVSEARAVLEADDGTPSWEELLSHDYDLEAWKE